MFSMPQRLYELERYLVRRDNLRGGVKVVMVLATKVDSIHIHATVVGPCPQHYAVSSLIHSLRSRMLTIIG